MYLQQLRTWISSGFWDFILTLQLVLERREIKWDVKIELTLTLIAVWVFFFLPFEATESSTLGL